MNFLLDTHYLIWTITDTKKISGKVKGAIVDPQNGIFVSTISFWEISLKSSLGKLAIKGFSASDLPDLCDQMGFRIETLSSHDSSTYHLLKANHHKDPFDKMLIWQAISNDFTLISEDKNIKQYESIGLKVFK